MSALIALDKLSDLYEESITLANDCGDGFGDEALVLKQLIRRARSASPSDQLELLILALNVHGTSENGRMAGKIAHRSGLPRIACPYPNESLALRLLANAWLEGWESSRRESEDASSIPTDPFSSRAGSQSIVIEEDKAAETAHS